ncbi:MAG: hypothetical protein M3Y54_22310, partial [Bacteroidota bacterium]|nr:hypothetical protein [Bacteroidota bacterium]
ALRHAGQLIGNNLDLPDEHLEAYINDLERAGIRASINPFRQPDREDARWEGLHDALQPVRNLVGPKQLVPQSTYDKIWDTLETVRCRVSYVAAEKAWAFFALRSSSARSGSWYMLIDDAPPQAELNQICQALQQRLMGKPAKSLEWKDDSDTTLNYFLSRLQAAERQLLPHRARRALDVAQHIVEEQLKFLAKTAVGDARIAPLREVAKLFRPVRITGEEGSVREEVMVDYEKLSAFCLELLLPEVRKLRRASDNPRVIISLRNLKKHWKDIDLSVEVLTHLLQEVSLVSTVDYRIAACIVGIATEPAIDNASV